jgi:hypothetical protein
VSEETQVPEQAESGQTKTIVRKQPKPLSLRDPGQLARAFAESGYWKHVTKPAQAVVIMAAGEELGLTPLASMQGITMIEGNIGYRGNLIAQLLRQHPLYDYKVLERSDESCTLQFTIDGEPIDEPEEGKVTFTVKDAERMELVKPRSNWVKTPRAMCFWRCLTEGARVHFPDLTMGTPVYSTDEIEEIVTEPLVVDAEVVEEDPSDSTPTLPDETVEHLAKGYELAKPALEANAVNALDGLNVRLGALGIDGFDPNTPVAEQLAGLTEEQAAALDGQLQQLVEQQGGETDGAD